MTTLPTGFDIYRSLGAGAACAAAGAVLGAVAGIWLTTSASPLVVMLGMALVAAACAIVDGSMGRAMAAGASDEPGVRILVGGVGAIMLAMGTIAATGGSADGLPFIMAAAAVVAACAAAAAAQAAGGPASPQAAGAPDRTTDWSAGIGAVVAGGGGLLFVLGGATARDPGTIAMGLMIALHGGGAAAAAAVGARPGQAVALLAFSLAPLGGWLGACLTGGDPTFLGFAIGASTPHAGLALEIARRSRGGPGIGWS